MIHLLIPVFVALMLLPLYRVIDGPLILFAGAWMIAVFERAIRVASDESGDE